MTKGKTFGALDATGWPSFYSMFLGFLTTYAGLMPILYRHELNASPKRNVATIVGLVVMALILITCVAYRIIGGCDTFSATLVGVLVGAAISSMYVIGLAFISDRKLTNILALPLLRDKAVDGKPIYVCEKA
jgi:uncharacterized membrane protein